MLRAAARVLRCYPLDIPHESLECTLAAFSFLCAPEEELPSLALLDELAFATDALWLRACWTPADLRGVPWWNWYGADHGMWA